MSAPRATARLPWHTIFIGALTLALIVVFLRRINLTEAWHAVLRAHLGWIVLATLVTLQTYLLRARRWQAILQPIGHATFRGAFRTTVIGYAANFLLPARVGEVLRPYLLARREHLDPAAAFATIIVERLLDLGMVLLLFAIALWTVGEKVGAEVQSAGAIAAGASMAGFVALFVLAGHPERLARWAGRLASRLPPGAARTVEHLVQTFVQGLKVMRSPAHLAVSLAWSLPLWLSIALGIFLTSRAFDLTMPFAGSFLVVGYLTVGVAAPTPGAVGCFHTAYLLAMTQFFGADENVAGAAAVVLHLLSFVPVTLMGLFFMWQDGLTLGGLKGARAEAGEAEAGEAS
jgi:uncharacterized protein (TIRG00374 family)